MKPFAFLLFDVFEILGWNESLDKAREIGYEERSSVVELLVDVDDLRLALGTAFAIVEHDDVVARARALTEDDSNRRVSPFLDHELRAATAAQGIRRVRADRGICGDGDVIFCPRGFFHRRETVPIKSAAVAVMTQFDVGRGQAVSQALLDLADRFLIGLGG